MGAGTDLRRTVSGEAVQKAERSDETGRHSQHFYYGLLRRPYATKLP